jgi:hypothetical protein
MIGFYTLSALFSQDLSWVYGFPVYGLLKGNEIWYIKQQAVCVFSQYIKMVR